MFLPLCFYVGFVFGNFLALFFCLSCFLFCFQSMKNTVFPAIVVFFEVKLVKCSLFFMFNVIVLVFSFLCCLFAI